MSRNTTKSKDKRFTIAHGFDSVCAFDANGENGYFVQIYDKEAKSETNDEGIILNVGFCPGISHSDAKKQLNDAIKKFNIIL